jgi:hypothetical protein
VVTAPAVDTTPTSSPVLTSNELPFTENSSPATQEEKSEGSSN